MGQEKEHLESVEQETLEVEGEPSLTPEEMENYITRLDYEGKEIILISTAHVSKDSIQVVRHTIEAEQPDSVCIELDDRRFASMENPKSWEETDIIKVIKNNQVGYLLASLVLSSYQRKVAKDLDTTVGGEMLQGIESGREVGAELVMADRDIQSTFLRIWRSMSLWEKCKLVVSLVFSFADDEEITSADLEEMLEQDVLESALSTMHGEFPKIGEILIDERDQHLANKIKNAPGPKVIAVLGGAHVPGVVKEIYIEQDMDKITTVPPKGQGGKILGWGIPILIVVLVIYSFTLGMDKGVEGLSRWMLWNSGLAGLFTLASLAHPITIIGTILLAPFSAINPVVAVGWFSGLIEASIRKPTVGDLQSIPDDIFSLKGFFKNRFLRILLIVMMANVGGSIGNIIGLGGLFKGVM